MFFSAGLDGANHLESIGEIDATAQHYRGIVER
jgi:hypothetical protein